jgi:hypothetical protein
MSRTSNSLFTLGKVAYYIGLLLLFNFFFGLLFFRFFIWLIAGGILLAALLGIISVGKSMLFGSGPKTEFRSSDNKTSQSPRGGYSDAIDVEAEVCDENK